MRNFSKLPVLLALTAALPLAASAEPAKPAKTTKTTKAPAAQKAPKPANYDRLIDNIEKIWGKPLTPQQKTGVIAAAKARTDAMKPIQEKFKADVAKALGTTEADMNAKTKAMHAKMRADKTAKPKA